MLGDGPGMEAVGDAVAVGGREVATMRVISAGRTAGGPHSGRPMVCRARHLSVEGRDGLLDPQAAREIERQRKSNRRFIVHQEIVSGAQHFVLQSRPP